MKEHELIELYDQRILDQLLRTGTVSRKDYDKFLKSLPDSEKNAGYITPYSEEDEKTPMSDDAQMAGLTFAPADTDE